MKKIKILFLMIISMMISTTKIKAMQVFIKETEEMSITLEVESSDTIEAVKQKIFEINRIEPQNQILKFNEKKLEDGRTLADYDIQKFDTIYIEKKEIQKIIKFENNNSKVEYDGKEVNQIITKINTDIEFTVIPSDGYMLNNVETTSGGIIKKENGKYTLKNITEDTVIKINTETVGIKKIEKINSDNNKDTYSIKLTDDQEFVFTIKNGVDGNDGITPLIRINSETNEWEVSYDNKKTWTSLGIEATGQIENEKENQKQHKSQEYIIITIIGIISLLGNIGWIIVLKKKK